MIPSPQLEEPAGKKDAKDIQRTEVVGTLYHAQNVNTLVAVAVKLGNSMYWPSSMFAARVPEMLGESLVKVTGLTLQLSTSALFPVLLISVAEPKDPRFVTVLPDT